MPKCKSKTKFLPAAFAWTLLLSCTTLFFYYPCYHWYWSDLYLWVIPLYQGILTVFVVMNFSLATFMDPGVIPRASADEDRDDDFRAPLYRNVEINGITVRMKWCVTCQFYRPPRCSHCSVCNNCIEIFDHHCPWVNNCIGRRNYRYFFMFLISLSVHMTSIFVLSLIHVLHKKDNLTEAPVLVSIVLIAVISLLFIPIFGLTGFHMVLVSRGRTTNEQVTGKFRGGYNPFSRNCCLNCCNTLCGPQYPSLKHPGKYIGKKPRKYTIPAKPLGPGGQLQHPQQMANDQVRVYKESPSSGSLAGGGVGMSHSHSAQYSRMNVVDARDLDDDMDEPMASQSVDSEAPLTHNSSKNNFFASPDDPPQAAIVGGRGSFKNADKFNPQYVKGSPHSSQRGHGGSSSKPRSQTPDHMLGGGGVQDGVEMRPLKGKQHQVSTTGSMVAASPAPPGSGMIQSPNIAQKVSRMGVPTPFAGAGSVASPLRYSHPHTVSSGARPEFISLQQQQHLQRHYETDMSKSYSPGTTVYTQQATSPGRRYLSEGELLESGAGIPTTSVADMVASNSPQRTYYVWKEPPQPHVTGYDQGYAIATSEGQTSPVRHTTYASQVNYYLQQSQVQQQQLQQQQLQPQQQQVQQQQPQPQGGQAQPGPQLTPALQSGGPRTTPSGYPGGPVVPSGTLSSPTNTTSISSSSGPSSSHMMPAGVVGYTTTGRPSTHLQQPMSFTRALEMTENIEQPNSRVAYRPQQQPQQQQQQVAQGQQVQGGQGGGGGDPGDGSRRDSVYDMNSYEISV